MSNASTLGRVLTLLLLFWIAAPLSLLAADSEIRLEVQLVWGTNEEAPRDKKLKPVDEELNKKLQKAYRWKKYFQVNGKTVKIAEGATQQLTMSEHCELNIKNLGHDRIEVRLIGEGKPVSRNIEPLPKRQILILAGDAKNDTAWFVVLRQAKD